MNELHISTGAVRLDIIRDGENVGVFKFNPKDISEAQRYSEVVTEMENKRVKYLEKAKTLDAENDIKAKIDFLAEYVKEMRNDIDKIYGEGTSNLAFGDTLDIDMFFDFIEGLAPYYKKASSERTAKYKNKSSKQS